MPIFSSPRSARPSPAPAVLLALLLFAIPLAARSGPERPVPVDTRAVEVGTLTSEIPAQREFVLHGTVPITPRPFDRLRCPLTVLAPDGTSLPTQWELVALLADFMIVEVRALVPGQWSGRQTFRVIEGSTPLDFSRFDPSAVGLALGPGTVQLVVQNQSLALQPVSLSGMPRDLEFHRFGSNTITFPRVVRTDFGDVQVWFSLDAHSKEVELIINWHNGGLPARPDVYFHAATLLLPAGWTWTSLLPDPATGRYYLVRPGDHVLPQRMERSFRLVLHPDDVVPDLTRRGWAVGDWSNGGYLAQSLPLPNLDHVVVDLAPTKEDDYARLASTSPTLPGDPPVSFLWPAHGVQYGGMTSGFHIVQCPAVLAAVTGQPEGLLSLYVEQLRYASRQMGCIYEADGKPLELDDYLNSDGTTPWTIFNNVFGGSSSPPDDRPFLFSQTGPGSGVASYDPLDFAPIDSQHLVRRTKANRALVWLDHDPLARQMLTMDSELSRMSYYEGPGGRLASPFPAGSGTSWGRAEAWVGDLMAATFAISDLRWRRRNAAWFVTYVDHLRVAQMSNGLFSAVNDGRIAEDPPYGDGQTAYYWVHRINEQVHLMYALRGVDRAVGLDTRDLVRECMRGIWQFAWKPGTQGPLDRYPAGPVGGARYTTRDEIPAGLTATVATDGYHVPSAMALGSLVSANTMPALLAYTATWTPAAARGVFESWGLDLIENRAVMLRVMQFYDF